MNTAPADEHPARVLLVEDDSIQITFIQALLAREPRPGFAIETVECLTAARERLESGGIDVILLDLRLPDSHGIQTVRAVRECSRSIPIIVLTGSDEEEMALEALKNGAQDYLVKSAVHGPTLARSIRYAIQRRSSEQVLGEQRRRLQLLMDSIPDVRIYFKDEVGRFIDVNPALAKFHGFNASQELIGKTDFHLFSSEHAEATREDELMVIHTGLPVVGKVEKETTPDGTTRWAMTTKMPLRGEEGQIIGTCGISRDITDLKRAEEQLIETNGRLTTAVSDLLKLHEELKATHLHLIQAEKLQSLGQMAAGVAHEIKNPLAILHLGIEYLGEYLHGRDEQINSVVTDLKDAVHRAETIIHGMLDYSAAKDLTLEPVALDSLISQTLRFVRYELAKAKVDVVTRFTDDLPALPLDAPKIQQVLVNIFSNACHAMPGGGTLTITTSQKVLEADEPKVEGPHGGSVAFHQGDKVAVIEICDTGTGIPVDTLQNIFGPFFTTKARGSGTGLGLSVAKKIIELHGGRISIANAPEAGARVTILLSCVPKL
jgi:PAS domain S-box-containing protein